MLETEGLKLKVSGDDAGFVPFTRIFMCGGSGEMRESQHSACLGFCKWSVGKLIYAYMMIPEGRVGVPMGRASLSSIRAHQLWAVGIESPKFGLARPV